MRPPRLLVFVFLLISMSLICPAPCNRAFDSQWGLSQHQISCEVFVAPDSRFVDAEAQYLAKRERKRQKISHAAADEHIVIDAIAPSVNEEIAGPSNIVSSLFLIMVFINSYICLGRCNGV